MSNYSDEERTIGLSFERRIIGLSLAVCMRKEIKNEPYIIFYDLEPIGIKKDSNPRP